MSSKELPEEQKLTGTIRTLSWYQTDYLGSLFRSADVLMIGRVDESADLVVQYKKHGQIDVIKIPFNPPTNE